MSDIADIVRAIGQQQGEYAYYRVCYSLLKRLQDTVAEVIEDLVKLHETPSINPSEGFSSAYKIAEQLRVSVQNASTHERHARSALSGLCSSTFNDVNFLDPADERESSIPWGSDHAAI